MTWDPSVLRKYNTTGHFRLLNQLRGELKSNPLLRPKPGQTVAEANRSRALQRATEGRDGRGGGAGRSRSSRRTAPLSDAAPAPTSLDELQGGPFTVVPVLSLDVAANPD